jgi:hypothetical protein
MDFEVVFVTDVGATIGGIGCIGCIGVCMEGTGTGCVTTDCATGDGKLILDSNGEGENDSTEEIKDNVGRKVVRKI